MRKQLTLLSLIILASMLLASCNFPLGQSRPTMDLNTQVALTLNALSTTVAAMPSNTPAPPTNTLEPTNTPEPKKTNTPQPTWTASPIPVPCDRGSFVQDITIPDGLVLLPGTKFTKTWELMNTGSCTWTKSYALVFADKGNAMGGPASKALPASVAPGEKIKISVDLVAPDSTGDYKGEWQLRNENNATFGIGPTAQKTFWVDITVAKEYDFANAVCSASWRNGSNKLECPGSAGDSAGYAFKDPAPVIETNSKENDAGLITVPQKKTDGVITGKYPALKIPAGSKFRTVLGCLSGATGCDVDITLLYSIDGGAETEMFTKNQLLDGSRDVIDYDLDALGMSGKNVVFIFKVTANGEFKNDKAFWLLPRIEQ